MRSLLHIVMGACLIVTATAVRANEVRIGVESALTADSNIFRLPDQLAIADGLWSIRPIFNARDETSRGTYNLNYRPLYRQYFVNSAASKFDQLGSLAGTYSFGPADMVSFKFNGSSYQGNRYDEDASGEVIALSPGNQKRDHAGVDLGYVHSFSQRLRMNGSVDFQWYGFDRQLSETQPVVEVDNRSLTGVLGLDYSFGPRTTMGLGVRGSWQKFQGEREIPDENNPTAGEGYRRPPSSTVFSTLYLSISYQFTKTMGLSFTAGPTLTDTDIDTQANTGQQWRRYPMIAIAPGEDGNELGVATKYVFATVADCSNGASSSYFRCTFDRDNGPTGTVAQYDAPKTVQYTPADLALIQGGTQTEFRFFALASIQKRWVHWGSSLTYERRDSAGSSQGASTILDTLRLQVDWRPDQQWAFSAQGAWVGRTNINRIPTTNLPVQSDPAPTPPSTPPGAVAEAADFYQIVALDSLYDTDTFRALLSGRYHFDKHLTFSGKFLFQRQQSESAVGARDYQLFVASFAATYYFDTFRF